MKDIDRIQKTLRRMHEQVPLRIDVTDQRGTVLASTHDGYVGQQAPEDACRLPVQGSPYVIAVEGGGPWAEHVARLAAMLLGETGDSSAKDKKQDWLYALLCGEWNEAAAHIRTVHMHGYIPCRVISICTDTPRAQAVSTMVKKAFSEPGQCLTCVMDKSTLAMIVPAAGQDREDCVQLAQAILDTMENELDVDGAAGISALVEGLDGISQAYDQAQSALKTGVSLGNRRSIHVYDDMVLERMVYSLSEEVRLSLVTRMLDGEGKYLLDAQMLHTAEVFMESGLNLSETARRLYVHRNTLIYRLDKIQKTVGLDLRNFQEAMVFRVLTMASRRGQEDDEA